MTPTRAPSRWLLVVILVMAVFTWTEAAWAQVPDDVAAVDQYRETIPTGAGKAGVGTQKKRGGTRLSTATRKSLREEAADVAPVLEEVATSPAFGAPTESLRRSGPRMKPERTSSPSVRPDESGTAGSAEPSPASAAVSAVTGDATGRVVGLLVVLFAISALVVGGAALRQRV